MPIRIAINGFGRIGRCAFKIALDNPNIEIVAINDLSNSRILAHLLKYDTSYGVYEKSVYVEEDGIKVNQEGNLIMEDHFIGTEATEYYLVVDGKKVKVIAEKEPELLPWKDLNIDVVLECTGRFTKDDAALAHTKAGAKKVVVSAPVKGGTIQTFLLGVNDDQYLGQNALSNASCTTNCVSPVISVMHRNFEILKSAMTTIHSITAEQSLVDGAPPGLHPDLRRARAAGHNIIPTTSGAAISTTEVITDLKGKFDGMAVRVPTLVGSLTDFTMLVNKKVSVEEVNKAFIEASKNPVYKNVLGIAYEPLVSSDIVKSPYSAIVDLTLTKVIDGDLVKVLAWYDNEWGYSNRLVEMAVLAGE